MVRDDFTDAAFVPTVGRVNWATVENSGLTLALAFAFGSFRRHGLPKALLTLND